MASHAALELSFPVAFDEPPVAPALPVVFAAPEVPSSPAHVVSSEDGDVLLSFVLLAQPAKASAQPSKRMLIPKTLSVMWATSGRALERCCDARAAGRRVHRR